MNDYSWNLNDDYIAHHGIQGMHWGIRRYQNEDGSLTQEGTERYLNQLARRRNKYYKKALKYEDKGSDKFNRGVSKFDKALDASKKKHKPLKLDGNYTYEEAMKELESRQKKLNQDIKRNQAKTQRDLKRANRRYEKSQKYMEKYRITQNELEQMVDQINNSSWYLTSKVKKKYEDQGRYGIEAAYHFRVH